MILIDSTIWIEHLRAELPILVSLLNQERVLSHPLIVGEIAMGSIKQRQRKLERLAALPQGPVARHESVLALVERAKLFSTGLSYIDAHLLASARLFPGGKLWTGDKRLQTQAERLGLAYTYAR